VSDSVSRSFSFSRSGPGALQGRLDVAVGQHQLGADVLGRLHRLLQLGPRLDPQLLAQAALVRRERQIRQQEQHLAVANHLEDVQLAPAIGVEHRVEARGAQLDAHGVRPHRLDGVPDLLDALLRDVRRAHQIDGAPVLLQHGDVGAEFHGAPT
jgi:hypothetical protein